MAAPPFPELQYLRQRAHAQCVGLAFRLGELVNDFPGGTPKDFIAVLLDILQELRTLIDDADNPGVLSWVCLLVQQDLSQYLKWLDNAHTAQTPRALVKVLEKAAAALLLSPNAHLLVAPDYECNYSIDDQIPKLHSLLVSFLPAAAMRRIFRRLPKALFLVQFPRVDRDHVLNYAIFGHELGHPLVQQVLDGYELSNEYKRQVKEVQRALKRLPSTRQTLAGFKKDKQERDFKAVSKIFRRGLEELLSDSVGVLIFGPTALFAAVDHFFANRLDNEPAADQYYPPTRYRHRRMLELLGQEGHVASLRAICQEAADEQIPKRVPAALDYIQSIVSKKDDIAVLQNDELSAIAYDWIERALPLAQARVRAKCKRFIYSADKLETEVPELVERLAIRLPPSERGLWPNTEPVDWRSSLVAGWVVRLGSASLEEASTDSGVKELQQVNKLTMKGIEDAILATEYRSDVGARR